MCKGFFGKVQQLIDGIGTLQKRQILLAAGSSCNRSQIDLGRVRLGNAGKLALIEHRCRRTLGMNIINSPCQRR